MNLTIQKVLKQDHQEILELLKKVSQARNVLNREKFFVEMKQVIDIHIHLEQLIFYNAVAEAKENEDAVLRCSAEHQQITDALMELDSLSKEDRGWKPKFLALKKSIQRHFQDEEGDLFQRAKKTLPQARLEKLGAEMATRTAEQLALQ
jgi:hemerythrin-like domain-containing protein